MLSIPSDVEVKNNGAMPLLPDNVFMAGHLINLAQGLKKTV
jgi:hypothetical protein